MSNIENNKLQLLEHQEEAYNETIKLFEEKGKAAVIFPTGCGKSFVTLKYILEHQDENILFLSPRNAIKDQMYEYIIKYIGGDSRSIEEIQKDYEKENNLSAALRTAAKEYIPNIECMLYQTMSGYGEKDSVDSVLEELKPDIIIVDEMHHLKTKSFKEAGRSNIVIDDESNDIVDDDEIENVQNIEEIEQQNKWGEKFHKFLENNPQAKLLGLSATPLRMDGANVVERMFEDSIASEISLLEAIEQGIIYPPKYVVPDFIREDELESLLQKIEQAEGIQKEQLKEQYDDLVKKSANAPGIPELMEEHIEEKDGKYIIFCQNINDMKEKMEKATEWFKKIDDEPEVYGIHSKDTKSAKQLEQFKASNSKHIKLLYCVGMIDEGMHLENISGVIITSKTESRLSYLQRIGRAISSGEEKRKATVIDLVNNNEILFNNTIQPVYAINEIEQLQSLIDWIDKNGGELPEFDEEKSIKERLMAKRLARINNKYLKYAENEELMEDLSEDKQDRIKNILSLGNKIGMFNDVVELDLTEKEKEIEDGIEQFLENIEIKGVRRDFRDVLSQPIGIMNVYLKNALEIENWCIETFKNEKIWERRLPNTNSKDEKEKRLGRALGNIRKVVLKKYEGKELEEIEDEEHRKIAEIVMKIDENYAYGEQQKHYYLGRVLEIENWCKKNFEGKEVWERRLPKERGKDEEEKRLGKALHNIKSNILKQYDGKELDEIKNEEHRKIAEIVRRIDEEYGLSINLKNILEIENWCKENFEKNEKFERRLPNQRAEDVEEKRLGSALGKIKSNFLKKYEGKELDEIEDKDDRRIVEIVRKLDEEYNPKKAKQTALKEAKQERDTAKQKNKETQELEERVEKELEKKDKNHEL